MNLAVKAATGGPAWGIAILVALITAFASFLTAIMAARSARSVKRTEVEAQHTRELESRISQRKFETYRPMIEMLGNLLNSNRQAGVLADQMGNLEKIAEFSTWVNVYGSDDAVKVFHDFMQAIYSSPPVLIVSRLYAEFILAARRDIGYPDTSVTAAHVMGMRINDLYSERDYRLAMTLPFDKLCRRENWTPPWLITRDLGSGHSSN